jgi:tetratricopeptide (TPR) repeat protein
MRVIFLFFIIFISGCSSQNKQSDNIKSGSEQLSNEEISLISGYQLLVNGNAIVAINKHFRNLTEQCEEEYENSENQVYAARSPVESLFYMLKAMSEKKGAVVISSTCAESNYYMGYASLELGRVKEAEQYVKRALAFSPVNSMYLSELAHIYQINKYWDKALTTFYQAEENASVYSPEQLKLSELTRAKRGIGFVLIELGQLQKAKLKFEECLELDPNDKNALNELNYIKGLSENS